jgi:hypothetical protein
MVVRIACSYSLVVKDIRSLRKTVYTPMYVCMCVLTSFRGIRAVA